MAESLGGGYAVILGVSSGFGAACALELARCGLDVVGVHLDRRSAMPMVDELKQRIAAMGREALFFNVNAADSEKRAEVVAAVAARAAERGLAQPPVKVLLHSLAFGTLRPFLAPDSKESVTQAQIEMTLDVMASSLLYWSQRLVEGGLMGSGGRIFAMTSEGSTISWPQYGPVSMAKAALEACVRQLAVELAPRAITVNAIRAGVTDTAALRKIPGSERMLDSALRRNPSGRLTTCEDVAKTVALLSRPESAWMTGNVLGVDGGEHVAGC